MRILNFLTLTIFISFELAAAPKGFTPKTFFGPCPTRSSGKFSMKLIENFEKNQSLYQLRSMIEKDHLVEKHFLSNYEVNFHPVSKQLVIKLNCPKPLGVVQYYNRVGEDINELILVDNGKLFDPVYAALLRSELKLKTQLPKLSLAGNDFSINARTEIIDLLTIMDNDFKKNVAELIITKSDHLTLILSKDGSTTSVFFGIGLWPDKYRKLRKIVNFMSKKKKIPAVINLANLKKVVVKFSE